MLFNFVDSESCEVNGEKMIYFKSPNILVSEIIKTLEKIGPQKFFSSPNIEVKRIRESMAEYFLTIALKKVSKLEWFVMQPKNDPPDFVLMAGSNNPASITLAEFELVEIHRSCKTFEEMMIVIQNKFDKGYPKNYNLLIFINNEKSGEWLNLFNQKLGNLIPFQSIWTVHVLQYKNKKNLFGCVINRIRPHPIVHIKASFDENILYQSMELPAFMEEVKIEGKALVTIKPDFTKTLMKEMIKFNVNRKQDQQDIC